MKQTTESNGTQSVEIALAADLNYLAGMTVTACSIAAHAAREVPLRFHLVHLGFTQEVRDALDAKIAAAHPNCETVYHDVASVDLTHFPLYASSRMTYARLMLPDLLPDVRHVIYSDVDILWLADITKLWALKGTFPLIACVREQSAKTLAQEKAWFAAEGLPFDETNYFCAGLSFYDLDAIRARKAFEAVADFARRHRGFNCADQSMLYGTFGGEVKLLPDAWQTFPRNGIRTAPDEPIVLHYAGEGPWKVTRLTHLLTDTQLLWFKAYASVNGETTAQALRHFYPARTVLLSRALFVILFRFAPLGRLVRALMRLVGFGTFDEALPRAWRKRKISLVRNV